MRISRLFKARFEDHSQAILACGPIIAQGNADGWEWHMRGKITEDGVWRFLYSGFNAAVTHRGDLPYRQRGGPSRAISCLEWGGELRPLRPGTGTIYVAGVVPAHATVTVRRTDGSDVTPLLVDVGHTHAQFFVSVEPPGSPSWMAIDVSDSSGEELDRLDRREFRR